MKLLIVDDETATRKGLMSHVDWPSLGVVEIRDAASGAQALKIVQQWPPDLVLSDICMAGMTGIELCRILQQLLPFSRFIFLSGYSDKEYLKAAIDMAVVGYIEKPIDLDEVYATAKKAIAQMKAEQANRGALEGYKTQSPQNVFYRRHSLFSLLLKQPINEHALAEFSDLYDQAALEGCFVRSVAVHIRNEQKDSLFYDFDLYRTLQEHLPEGQLLAFISPTRIAGFVATRGGPPLPENAAITQALTQWLGENGRMFLSLGTVQRHGASLAESYEAASNGLENLFFLGYGKLCYPSNRQSEALPFENEMYDRFSAMLSERHKEKSLQLLAQVHQRITAQAAASVDVVHGVYVRLLHSLYAQSAQAKKRTAEGVLQELQHFIWKTVVGIETFADLHQYLVNRVHEFFEDFPDMPTNSRNVMHVIGYIKTHYADAGLSLHSISDDAYLAPTYLASVFKKEIGVTVGQYILAVRMEQAKKLLADPQMRMSAIALETGFATSNYFSKAFKKVTGMLPSEYREFILCYDP